MSEKQYTREEIFEILKDPQKFAEFCQNENQNKTQINEELEDKPLPDNYEAYLGHRSEMPHDFTYLDGNGNLYRAPSPFMGKNVPKINKDEYELLEFCHNTDMIPFLREEFERNPIDSRLAQEQYERRMVESFNPNDFRNDNF